MQQTPPQIARNLSPLVRTALEQLLGRPLDDSEAISVRAWRPQEGLSSEHQRQMAEQLRRFFEQIDEKTKDIPDEELDDIFDEAIRSVRPRYRSQP